MKNVIRDKDVSFMLILEKDKCVYLHLLGIFTSDAH